MFQFPAFPSLARPLGINPERLPYLGNLRIIAYLAAPRSFSQLSHVLHRLWTPRHPPYTLGSLTILFVLVVMIATLPLTLFSMSPNRPRRDARSKAFR